MMKRTRKLVLCKSQLVALMAVTLAGARSTVARNEIIDQTSKPLSAHSLSGKVLDPSGADISGVTVEELTKPFGEVMTTVQTDSHGRFAFPSSANGTHYLKISSPGFNTLIICVKVRPFNTYHNLHIKLSVAT